MSESFSSSTTASFTEHASDLDHPLHMDPASPIEQPQDPAPSQPQVFWVRHMPTRATLMDVTGYMFACLMLAITMSAWDHGVFSAYYEALFKASIRGVHEALRLTGR